MPITFVQSANAHSSVPQGSINVAPSSFPTPGNLALVLAISQATILPASTVKVTDAWIGNFFSAIAVTTSTLHVELFYGIYPSGSGGDNIVLEDTSSGGSSYLSMIYCEYSGTDQVNPLDGASANAGVGVVPAAGTPSVSGIGELLFGGVGVVLGSIDTISPGAGFTERFESAAGANNVGAEAEDRLVSAPTAVNWSLSLSAIWAAVSATFKASGDPGITSGSGMGVKISSQPWAEWLPTLEGRVALTAGPGLGIPTPRTPQIAYGYRPWEELPLLEGKALISSGPGLGQPTPVTPKIIVASTPNDGITYFMPFGGIAQLSSLPSALGRIGKPYIRPMVVLAEPLNPLQHPPTIIYGGQPSGPVGKPSLRNVIVSLQSDDLYTDKPGQANLYGGKASGSVSPPVSRQPIISLARDDSIAQIPDAKAYGGGAYAPATPPIHRPILYVGQEDIVSYRPHPEGKVTSGPIFKLPPGPQVSIVVQTDDSWAMGRPGESMTYGGRAVVAATPPTLRTVATVNGPDIDDMERLRGIAWVAGTVGRDRLWAPNVRIFSPPSPDIVDTAQSILVPVPLKSGQPYSKVQVYSAVNEPLGVETISVIAPFVSYTAPHPMPPGVYAGPSDLALLETASTIIRPTLATLYVQPPPPIIGQMRVEGELLDAYSANLLVMSFSPVPVAAYPQPAPPTELEPNTYTPTITLRGRSA